MKVLVVITVLRGRLRPGAEKEYRELGIEMYRLASAMPGFVSAKSFMPMTAKV
jgi:antibiotic biosynthesis monooxygenase (ABM) superfamily enzyme